MDDIVTRLRIESASSVDVIRRLDMKCLCCPCCEESCLYCETVGEMAEAADEIERLRADNEELLEIAKNLANEGKCYAYEDQWGMCVHSDCRWHSAEHAWQSYCMRRGL